MMPSRSFASLCIALAFGVCAMATRPAVAADANAASKYIETLANETLATISDKGLSKDQKQTKLETLFSGNVDIPWVGKFVMGTFWRQATDDQKSRYLQHYQTFIIRHYTSRFTDYTSGTFKMTGAKDDGEGEFTVSMTIQGAEANSQPVLVDYRVRTADKGAFKIFDINVEGVSMITTQRSEFSSVLNQNGIDYLINQLDSKSKLGE